MSKETIFLKCGACGHDNEPERVYCHNCGQKLDRSLLPPPEARKDHEPDADKHKRVKKMMQVGAGGKGSVKQHIFTAIKILVFAAIIASLVLFWQKPDQLAPAKFEDLPRNVGEAWKDLMAENRGQKLTLTEMEVNYYLKNTVKGSDAIVPGVKFERAYVTFNAGPDGSPGTVTITAQRDAWSLPLYSSMTLSPRERDGKVEWDVIGVHFGRLGIHPSLKFLGNFALSGVKKAFEKEIGQAGSRLRAVLPGDKVITLETNPSTGAAQ